jgi:hypothetical protein
MLGGWCADVVMWRRGFLAGYEHKVAQRTLSHKGGVQEEAARR